MRELFLCSVCKKDVDNTHDEKICYDNQRGKEKEGQLMCKHKLFVDDRIVSGYGLTEYAINFCQKCGKVFWKFRKDIEDLYPRYSKKPKWRQST